MRANSEYLRDRFNHGWGVLTGVVDEARENNGAVYSGAYAARTREGGQIIVYRVMGVIDD